MLPLDKLETRSEVRGTLDLLDEKGRKPVGGKMEVVARLREPFTGVTSSPPTLTHSHTLTLHREGHGGERGTVAGIPRGHSSNIIKTDAPPIPCWLRPLSKPLPPLTNEGGKHDQC